ncbi:hypothetical protein CO038_00920 [Candidatus Pacearchaeota archaeon CG_4_9_14_0_2_um_filter_39_13]|nr:hypothetical protein [Candidatus Pacearchaeota archaeon]OIO42937.1 MAG: hypothetical protein AUJ64_03125 [Candidatus Pacearchaeota archaeon CG1_02_39_14]PJC44997.1 MAG: hypothetical protein CO038_00920 [Candidatus Pacearchaeota archaeon CG_4_9_14_0_2_um_filter_39_13]
MNIETLYHALRGNPGEAAESFREGARSDLSDGNGQGRGFYVWRNRDYALEHLSFLEESGIQGDPIIVHLNSYLNPGEWDIDHELHPSFSASFLYDNLNFLRQIPDGQVKTERGRLLPSKTRISNGSIVFAFDRGRSIGTFAMRRQTQGGHIGAAEILGRVIEYMQSTFPGKMIETKREWLSSPDVVALAYRGKTPLPVERLETLQD